MLASAGERVSLVKVKRKSMKEVMTFRYYVTCYCLIFWVTTNMRIVPLTVSTYIHKEVAALEIYVALIGRRALWLLLQNASNYCKMGKSGDVSELLNRLRLSIFTASKPNCC
jgi:hypothetical protein